MGAMLVDMTLEVVVNLLLQHSRAGVPEYPNRDLAVVVVGTLDIDKDFDVARLSVARNDAGNLEIRGRFARGFRSDLRNSANSQSVFNHDSDRYTRSDTWDHMPRKNLRCRYTQAGALRNSVMAMSTLLRSA